MSLGTDLPQSAHLIPTTEATSRHREAMTTMQISLPVILNLLSRRCFLDCCQSSRKMHCIGAVCSSSRLPPPFRSVVRLIIYSLPAITSIVHLTWQSALGLNNFRRRKRKRSFETLRQRWPAYRIAGDIGRKCDCAYVLRKC